MAHRDLRLGKKRFTYEDLILYRDDYMVAIAKPAGVPSAPVTSGVDLDLETYCKQFDKHLQLVHRLDKSTTGILVFARGHNMYRALSVAFERRKVTKTYHAICGGALIEDVIEIEMPLTTGSNGVVRPDKSGGKMARTKAKTLEALGAFQLVAARPREGRKHQVRVHLAYVGRPIVGDAQYGGSDFFLSQFKRKFHLKKGTQEQPLNRGFLLHARELILPHPDSGKPLALEAPYPENFALCLRRLRELTA